MEQNNFFIKAGKAYDKYKEREEAWRSLEAVMTLAAVILLLVFAISPTVRAISGLLAEINNKKELSRRMKVKIDQVIAAQMSYADVQDKIFLLEQYYPDKPQLAEGISQLVGIVKQHDLSLKQIAIKGLDFANIAEEKKGKKSKGELPGIGFTLEASGNYQQIKSFLSSAYQGRRGIVITNYQIDSAKEKDSSGLAVRLEGKLLFAKEGGGSKK